ncbi:ATP-binding protein [Ancylobacter pratisalsi]|uniref:C4-dicarboxylate transport sensor protein DctB n=1 Tax=Ancylobacter pratisalsi TaxID=1745854 RepID=A0A6P1YP91_9HYPH|nr:ATP-binding protein [Ancylobacter pratisalsi]QIB33963.1 two-component sensor histidine kinase [Ancylobacter pratisalsi]
MRAQGTRFGIGGRLLAAFIGVGALAVVACMVGWLSYARLSSELDSTARGHVPALVFAAQLSQAGGRLTAAATELATAERRDAHDAAMARARTRLGDLRALLDTAPAGDASARFGALRRLVDALGTNLDVVDAAARRRFDIETRTRAIVDELRWLQADLVDEVEPLVEDARFNIHAALEQVGQAGEAALAAQRVLRDETAKTEAILALSAQAHLSIGLLGQVASVRAPEDLRQTGHFLGEAADELVVESTRLKGWADSITVRQIVARLAALANAVSGLPGLRGAEIAASEEVQARLGASRDLAAELGDNIAAVARRIETDARAAAARAAEAIVVGRSLLLGIAVLSLGVAVLVGWFYVRRSLITRLERLTLAAGAIAGGGTVDLPAPTTHGYFGEDELDELSRALAIFRQTRDELVQSAKLAALGQMAAGIGHELNQPLAAIRSHAHNGAVLLARGRGEDAATSLARIEGLTVRMAQSIAHLKRFARRPEPEIGTVSLDAVIEGALSLFAQRIADEQIEVVRAVPAGLLVLAEEVRLEQVVVNLIANAMDAVRDAHTRRIVIDARRDGEHVSIAISDTGSGIEGGLATDIFDPFFTTKPPGAGLGLGLSLSFNIIRDFGGRLLLKESSPAGSTFTIELREVA